MRASVLTLALAFLAPCTYAAPTFGILSTIANIMEADQTLPSSSLPGPDGLVLKYIALGVGTQNYSCASTTAAPVAVGAVATLYDATASKSIPIAGRIMQDTMTCSADKANTGMGLRAIGHHFFSSTGVPTFDLQGVGAWLSSKKVAADSNAAEKSCNGRDGGAAVPWLKLIENGDGTSKRVKAVYRVRTAGGAAPATCDGVQGILTRDYAAEYWFYE